MAVQSRKTMDLVEGHMSELGFFDICITPADIVRPAYGPAADNLWDCELIFSELQSVTS